MAQETLQSVLKAATDIVNLHSKEASESQKLARSILDTYIQLESDDTFGSNADIKNNKMDSFNNDIKIKKDQLKENMSKSWDTDQLYFP